MVHLDYRDARPVYEQIADGFREQILSGVLQKGDKMPSVRELATTMTINPNTIQRVYRELEQQGWIHSEQGRGCFVSGVPCVPDAQQEALLQEFDRIVWQLRRSGISEDALRARLEKGGEGK